MAAAGLAHHLVQIGMDCRCRGRSRGSDRWIRGRRLGGRRILDVGLSRRHIRCVIWFKGRNLGRWHIQEAAARIKPGGIADLLLPFDADGEAVAKYGNLRAQSGELGRKQHQTDPDWLGQLHFV